MQQQSIRDQAELNLHLSETSRDYERRFQNRCFREIFKRDFFPTKINQVSKNVWARSSPRKMTPGVSNAPTYLSDLFGRAQTGIRARNRRRPVTGQSVNPANVFSENTTCLFCSLFSDDFRAEKSLTGTNKLKIRVDYMFKMHNCQNL